jgi:hypothetical protein
MPAIIEAKDHARWFDGANDRMEQSEKPGPVPRSFPNFALLHPGYDFRISIDSRE